MNTIISGLPIITGIRKVGSAISNSIGCEHIARSSLGGYQVTGRVSRGHFEHLREKYFLKISLFS